MLNIPELCEQRHLAELLGVRVTTISRWAKDGKLPEMLRVSNKKAFWTRDQIEGWLNRKPMA